MQKRKVFKSGMEERVGDGILVIINKYDRIRFYS